MLKELIRFSGSGGDVMDTQDPMLDLVCSLDEQTAMCEQLSGVSDQQLMSVMCRLSDAGLCHMCSLLCSMSASEQSRLGSLVCRHLLLPRVSHITLYRNYSTREFAVNIILFKILLPTSLRKIPHFDYRDIVLIDLNSDLTMRLQYVCTFQLQYMKI